MYQFKKKSAAPLPEESLGSDDRMTMADSASPYAAAPLPEGAVQYELNNNNNNNWAHTSDTKAEPTSNGDPDSITFSSSNTNNNNYNYNDAEMEEEEEPDDPSGTAQSAGGDGAALLGVPPPESPAQDVLQWCRDIIIARNITPPRSWRQIRFDLPNSIPNLELFPPTPVPVDTTLTRPSSCLVLLLEDIKPEDKTVKTYTYEMIAYLLQLLQHHRSTTAITELRVVKKGHDVLQQLIVVFGKDVKVATALAESLKTVGVPVAYGPPQQPIDKETPNATFLVMDFVECLHAYDESNNNEMEGGDPAGQNHQSGGGGPERGALSARRHGVRSGDLEFLFAPFRPSKTKDVFVIEGYEPGVFYAPVKRPETVLSFLCNSFCSVLIQTTLFERYGILVVMAPCPHRYLIKGVPYHIQKKQQEAEAEQRRRQNSEGGASDVLAGNRRTNIDSLRLSGDALKAVAEEEQMLEDDSDDDEEAGRGGRAPYEKHYQPSWVTEASRAVNIFADVDSAAPSSSLQGTGRDGVIGELDLLMSGRRQGRTAATPAPASGGGGVGVGAAVPPQYGLSPPIGGGGGGGVGFHNDRERALKSILVEEEDSEEDMSAGPYPGISSRHKGPRPPVPPSSYPSYNNHSAHHHGDGGGADIPITTAPPQPPVLSYHVAGGGGAITDPGNVSAPREGNGVLHTWGSEVPHSRYNGSFSYNNDNNNNNAEPWSAQQGCDVLPQGGGILGALPSTGVLGEHPAFFNPAPPPPPPPQQAEAVDTPPFKAPTPQAVSPESAQALVLQLEATLHGEVFPPSSSNVPAAANATEQHDDDDSNCWLRCISPTATVPPIPRLRHDHKDSPAVVALHRFLQCCVEHCAEIQGILLLRVPDENVLEGEEEAILAALRPIRRRVVNLLMLAPPVDQRALDWVPVSAEKEQQDDEEGKAQHHAVLLPAVLPYLLHCDESRRNNNNNNNNNKGDNYSNATHTAALDDHEDDSAHRAAMRASAACGRAIVRSWVVSLSSSPLTSVHDSCNNEGDRGATNDTDAPAAARVESAQLVELIARFIFPVLFSSSSAVVELVDIVKASLEAHERCHPMHPHPLVRHVIAHWPAIWCWLYRRLRVEDERSQRRTVAFMTNTLDRLLAALPASAHKACREHSARCNLLSEFFTDETNQNNNANEEAAQAQSGNGTADTGSHTSEEAGATASYLPSCSVKLWGPFGSLAQSLLRLYLNADVLEGTALALRVLTTPPPPPPATATAVEVARVQGDAAGPGGVTRDHYRFFLSALSSSIVSPLLSRETSVFCGVFVRAAEIHLNRVKSDAKRQAGERASSSSTNASAANSALHNSLTETDMYHFVASVVRRLPTDPSLALSVFLPLRQSYFDIALFQELCRSWFLVFSSGSTEEQHGGGDSVVELAQEKVAEDNATAAVKQTYRRNLLEEHLPQLQRFLNSRRVPTEAEVNTLVAQCSTTTTTSSSALTNAASAGNRMAVDSRDGGPSSSPSVLPYWDPAWTDILNKYPKSGRPFPPPPPNYSVELSRSYGFYYFKPKSDRKVHASPTYKHPNTGEEYMASPQAFLSEHSVSTTLKDLLHYAQTKLGPSATSSGEVASATVPLREAEQWFNDQRVRHRLLDAAVMVKLKVNYKVRSSRREPQPHGAEGDEERSSRSRQDRKATTAIPSSSPSHRLPEVAGSLQEGRRPRRGEVWEGPPDAIIAQLLAVTETYPASPEQVPFPALPKGWVAHLSTINGLYMFRSSAPLSVTRPGAGGVGGFHQHPTARRVFRVTPQALAKNRRVNPSRLREVAEQIVATRAAQAANRPHEEEKVGDGIAGVQENVGAAEAHTSLSAVVEEKWWSDQRIRHPILDRALIQLLKVDYEHGEEQIRRDQTLSDRKRARGGGDPNAEKRDDEESEESENNSQDDEKEGGSTRHSGGGGRYDLRRDHPSSSSSSRRYREEGSRDDAGGRRRGGDVYSYRYRR